MAHQAEPPSYDPARGRFLEYVKRHCELEVIDPGDSSQSIPSKTRAFVPRDLLQTYLESHHYRELKAIIEGLKCGLVNLGHIIPRYTAVFCTLLHSGRGSWIKHFTRHESLMDIALPFDSKSPPRNWPQAPGDPNFLSDFCRDQWRFCAPTLTDPVSDQCFEDERILPITYKRKLRDGGTAKLWLINIHPSYNKLISEEHKQTVGKENANTFVLKEYSTADAQKYYENETSAFDQIGKHPHIISYFGSFTRNGSFNVILEYADKGTLKEYFEKQLPPTSGEEIIKFWEGLFQLINALWKIHTMNGDAIEGPQIFRGWHQDVKPENILVLSNGSKNPQDWHFKLADLGISHFKRGESLREDSTASDSYGTHTYGALDSRHLETKKTARNKLRVHQNIDIWSLGCIYSEAVRWMADNKLGVVDYRRERKVELSQIHPVGEFDCFHNGYEALEAVRRSHQTALTRIRSLRRADFITEKVVDMIGDMLVETKHRPTAENMWRKQRTIIDAAKKNLQESRKPLHASGSDFNSSNRSQARSVTHPVPGPSSNSEPATPPVLPPEYRQKGTILGPRGHPVLPAVHEHGPEYGLMTGASAYDFPRNHSPDTMDREFGSPETTPVQELPDTGVLQNPSPLTPPFSPKHRHPEGGSTDFGEDPFISPTQHDATALPYRPPRGASNLSNTSTGIDSTPISGIGRSSTGSLGRNDHRTRFIPGVNGNGSPGTQRPLTTTGLCSETSPENAPQRETSHSSGTSRPHSQINGQADVDDHRLPTGLPARQGTVTQEPQTHQNQESTHRPVLQTATSDFVTLGAVLDWKRKCKSDRFYRPFLNRRHQDRLKGRDHVFLVDDSFSMVQHWPNVTKVIEGLSYILKDADKNGLDLYFTISEQSTNEEKHTSSLVRLVERHKQNDPDASTEINFRLNQILDKYKAKLDSNGCLYILTNGVWEAECKPEIPIKNVVQKLQDLRKDREQIGIQFISFGNDTVGMERLRRLDDDLTRDLKLDHDIVDTTPWDDNICKMLLGHLNENMDKQRPSTANFASPPGFPAR
ncbi:hypothetical protein BKA61DRAFT_600947 [Leptodontidium sp. MPI-SDFR-AT-0119]|nr:hypothetical protein BKA61DRAFT_600947 [Leptodontidium sp. MPI-SDFR-AT-0119]